VSLNPYQVWHLEFRFYILRPVFTHTLELTDFERNEDFSLH
jgi:hypothetical protein